MCFSSLLIPAKLLVIHESFKLTAQTKPVMAANRPAAGWAAPFLLLRLQETLHPIIPDCIQVFDHAHVVFSAIAFIQAFQAFAGVFSTFKTKPDLAISKQIPPV